MHAKERRWQARFSVVRGPCTFARKFPRAVAFSLSVSDARVPARTARADYSRTAKSGISARLYTAIFAHPLETA
jgi:hypothetical protein